MRENYKVREKGLCYRCDDKWSLGHRCKRRELSVLLTCDGEDEEPEFSPNNQQSEEQLEVISEQHPPEISLNSVMGISIPRTLTMLGCIEGKKVVVMVDPGATHNFISIKAVSSLGFPVTSSQVFGVSLGTMESVQGVRECKSVVLELQGIVIVENFLSLPLGNSDLILGIQWLEKPGTMTTNWKIQTLKFQTGKEMVTLKGDPSLGRSGISLKAMLRNIQK